MEDRRVKTLVKKSINSLIPFRIEERGGIMIPSL
jgi:hypothetical protein